MQRGPWRADGPLGFDMGGEVMPEGPRVKRRKGDGRVAGLHRVPDRTELLPVRAARMLRRLRGVRGLDDGEKSLHALGRAATPQERWDLWERQMRSAGYWKPSSPRPFRT